MMKLNHPMLAVSLFLSLAAGCASAPTKAPAAVPNVRGPSSAEPDATQVTVLLFGDSGTGDQKQIDLGRKMHEACTTAGCSFAVGLGDNIYESGASSALDRQFITKFEKPYEPFGRFDFWMIAGNHDHGPLLSKGNVRAQIDYSEFSERWRMPGYHYKIPGLPEWLNLYGIDTEKADAVQAAIAEKHLCGKKGWKILFGHHPILSNGKHGGDRKTTQFLMPVIRKCGVQLVFSGHDHHQEHISAQGFDQIIQGAAAKIRDVRRVSYPAGSGLKQEFAAGVLGFAILKFTEDRLSGDFYDQTGASIYRFEKKL